LSSLLDYWHLFKRPGARMHTHAHTKACTCARTHTHAKFTASPLWEKAVPQLDRAC